VEHGNVPAPGDPADALDGPADLFKAMFDTSRVASFVFDEATFEILIANEAALRFYGYSSDRFTSLKVPDLVDADHWNIVGESLRGGHPRDVENVHRHADGHLLPVSVSAYRLVFPTRVIWNVQVQDRAALAEGVRASIDAAVTSVERALRARDPYTANHQVRVAALACAIGERLGFTDDQMLGLRTAAELHDIGKIGLPSEILNFPGPLSAPAVELIRTHPRVGHDMIETIPFTTPVARIVLEHHERIDGSGYPARLTGEQMLPESRVLAVADVAEAMTAHRPYRPALPVSAALDELERGRGRAYDRDAVDHCRDLLTGGFEFPGLALG
jgi:PAS domain S-box-containing protein/putative nucleotidyltransferase with HDIG domain